MSFCTILHQGAVDSDQFFLDIMTMKNVSRDQCQLRLEKSADNLCCDLVVQVSGAANKSSI